MQNESRIPWWLLIAAVATIVLALWGWILKLGAASGTDALSGAFLFLQSVFLALRAVLPDDKYSEITGGDWPWQLHVARWLGIVVFGYAVLSAVAQLFSRQYAQIRAARARKHLIVVGDHPLADAVILKETRGFWTTIVHITERTPRPIRRGKLVVLPARHASLEAMLAAANASQSSRIFLAHTDDAATHQAASTTIDAIGAGRRGRMGSVTPAPSVIAHIKSPWLAQRLHRVLPSVSGKAPLTVVSESVVGARLVCAKHPQFLLAIARNYDRVRILIVGLGPFCEALIDDVAANSAFPGLEKPEIIVVDPGAKAWGESYSARRPALAEAATVTFHASLDGVKDALKQIVAVYVCGETDTASVDLAIALRERCLQDRLLDAPVFVRTQTGAGLREVTGSGAWDDKAPLRTELCPLVAFGRLDRAAAYMDLGVGDPDWAAKAYHEAYRAFRKAEEATATSIVEWGALDEDFKTANRRAVAHIPAKLASQGFPIEGWLNGDGFMKGLPALDAGERLYANDAEKVRLAKLEHDRWMADRLVNGWRQRSGKEPRDTARRIHIDLVPFEQVSDGTRDYALKLIEFLDSYIPRMNGGLKRLVDDAV